MAPRQRIGIMSLSAIPDDPRVRRQGDAFTAFGCDVTAVGLPGARSSAPSWKVVDVTAGSTGTPNRSTAAGDASKPSFAQRSVAGKAWIVTRALTNMVRTGDPIALYWSANPIFEAMYQVARRNPADVWIANDWTTLPIALRLWREMGIPYHYDTHEFATEENAQRLAWRITRRPLIRQIERTGIAHAESVSTVSEPIAQAMQRLYGLEDLPLVIRNLPGYEEWPPRSPDGKTRILYHGIVAPHRGLETIIESSRYWSDNHTLTIRGPGQHYYIEALKERCAASGAGSISIEDPVPMTDLIREASRYDIGIALFPSDSYQAVYALPNKLFEYIMSGLAVVGSDYPSMASIINQNNVGIATNHTDPRLLASALMSLSPDDILTYKANSRKLSATLNWNHEKDKLKPICNL